jgi:hypothetical protein
MDGGGEANLMSILRKSYRAVVEQLTAAERLDEIAEILAAGLMRARAKQSSPQSADGGESSLDCPADQSGHANVLNGDVE